MLPNFLLSQTDIPWAVSTQTGGEVRRIEVTRREEK